MKAARNRWLSLLCGVVVAQQASALEISCYLSNDFPGSGTPGAEMAVTLWAEAYIHYTDLTVWNDANYHYGSVTGPGCVPLCLPGGNPWYGTNTIFPPGQARTITLWSAQTSTYTMYSSTQNWYVEPDGERYENGESEECTKTGLVRRIGGPRP